MFNKQPAKPGDKPKMPNPMDMLQLAYQMVNGTVELTENSPHNPAGDHAIAERIREMLPMLKETANELRKYGAK